MPLVVLFCHLSEHTVIGLQFGCFTAGRPVYKVSPNETDYENKNVDDRVIVIGICANHGLFG